jgi:hypothetical protein
MKSVRKWTWLVVVTFLVMALGADEGRKTKGIFSGLKVGQSVSLKDEGSAFTITFFDPDLQQSHKVIEIGSDYVVLRDIAEVTETTIPIYSVKAIIKVKTKAQ